VMYFGSALLVELFDLLQLENLKAIKSSRSLVSEMNPKIFSMPHCMIKLLLLLSRSPSNPGKRSDVMYFPSAEHMDTEQENDADEGDSQTSEEIPLYPEYEDGLEMWVREFDEADDTEEEEWDRESEGESEAEEGRDQISNDGIIVHVPNEHDEECIPDWDGWAGCGYGYQLSLHGHVRLREREEESIGSPLPSSHNMYCSSLLSPLPAPSGGTICTEIEICHRLLSLISGVESDVFTRNTAAEEEEGCDSGIFSLSPLGRSLRIVHMSRSSLLSLLRWFLCLGNMTHVCRRAVARIQAGQLHALRETAGVGETGLILQIQGAALPSLSSILSDLDEMVSSLTLRLISSPDPTEGFSPTLVQLHIKLLPYFSLIRRALSGVARSCNSFSSSDREAPLAGHSAVLSLITHLGREVDASHLVSCPPSLLRLPLPSTFDGRSLYHSLLTSMYCNMLSCYLRSVMHWVQGAGAGGRGSSRGALTSQHFHSETGARG
jgi:hypothetical protein